MSGKSLTPKQLALYAEIQEMKKRLLDPATGRRRVYPDTATGQAFHEADEILNIQIGMKTNAFLSSIEG